MMTTDELNEKEAWLRRGFTLRLSTEEMLDLISEVRRLRTATPVAPTCKHGRTEPHAFTAGSVGGGNSGFPLKYIERWCPGVPAPTEIAKPAGFQCHSDGCNDDPAKCICGRVAVEPVAQTYGNTEPHPTHIWYTSPFGEHSDKTRRYCPGVTAPTEIAITPTTPPDLEALVAAWERLEAQHTTSALEKSANLAYGNCARELRAALAAPAVDTGDASQTVATWFRAAYEAGEIAPLHDGNACDSYRIEQTAIDRLETMLRDRG